MEKSILYIGSLNEYSNSYGRFKTLKLMGNKMIPIDTDPYIFGGLFEKFHHHLNAGPGITALNNKILEIIKAGVPDVLWVDNKPFLQTGTLKKIRRAAPSIKIINLITDDPTGKYRSSWMMCLRTAKYYDFHFVQREVNKAELKNYGARQVEMCYRSFDPDQHRPVTLTEEDMRKYKTGTGFIGTYEREREDYIIYLLQNNVNVSITGNDWEKARHWEMIQPYYKGPSVYGEAYVKTINGFDIALHFLRHANRDEQDSRTFELPACGAFMLAEKSGVHQSLFDEGKEAVFFESKEELLEKVKYYLAHPAERMDIAEAGRARCFASGYTHEERLRKVIETIFS